MKRRKGKRSKGGREEEEWGGGEPARMKMAGVRGRSQLVSALGVNLMDTLGAHHC